VPRMALACCDLLESARSRRALFQSSIYAISTQYRSTVGGGVCYLLGRLMGSDGAFQRVHASL
jgi:hypothetical protein